MVLRKKGILQRASHVKHQVPFPPGGRTGMQHCEEWGKEIQFCGQESSTFPLGTEKEQEVRRGHSAESNHVLLCIFWSGPSSPRDSSQQPGSARSRLRRGWADANCTPCCALRPTAPPNEQPQTTRGRGRGGRF